jgi:hypothetical protein
MYEGYGLCVVVVSVKSYNAMVEAPTTYIRLAGDLM